MFSHPSALRPLPFALSVALFLSSCGAPPAPPAPGPAEVTVQVITPQDVPENGTFVGRTVADRTVELRARVTGTLSSRPYDGGTLVQQGAPLFVLDQREFAAALQAAEAKVAQAAAQLAKAEADFGRIEPLAKAGAAPQTELDASRAALLSAKAGVASAAAALERARLDLEYATITAPFTGLVSNANVDPGALISPSTGALAVIDRVDPMAIEFTVSESELLAWRRGMTDGTLKAPAMDQLSLTAQLVDGSTYPNPGHISFRDIRISPQTGTALIHATFPNPEGGLRAGQFVRVHIAGAIRVGALIVPQGAVLQSPTGASLLVVGAGDKVEARPVVLGAWRDTGWIITSGLKAGETVIVEGLQKARPGAVVKPTPAPVAVAPVAATAAPAK
jgi:membrane fusion protein (multidrug efflux system)